MAIVYLARDLKHHRPVALKVMLPELAASVGPARFLQEIQVTARLQHPHILPLIDSGEANGAVYYVMPYVEGESLRDRLKRDKQLSIEDALRISREVALALDYAHHEGVVHRDIKPENILFSNNQALVADFGVARALEGAGRERLTATGLSVGTSSYMSPEQAAGERDLDGRSDVYSLGCMLYEMLVGEVPFGGPSARAVAARHFFDPVPSIRIVRPSVGEALELVVRRSMAKVPADRFPSAAGFADALTLAEREGLERPAPTVQPEPRHPYRRTRTLVAAAVVAVAVAGATAVRVWIQHRPDLVPGRVVVGLFENRTGDPSMDPLGAMAADWLTDGILRSGFAEVVPTGATLLVATSRSPNQATSEASADLRALADETGAGIIVAGSYYRLRDSLQFQTQVIDARHDKLIRVVAPISGPAEHPLDVIEKVRQRVVGALAVHFDTAAPGGLGLLNTPPTYGAYNAYLAALRDFSQLRFAEAIPHLDMAFALDSTFTSALLAKAWANANVGELGEFDSLAEALEAKRDQLSPAEGYELDWLKATRRGDLNGARRALHLQVAVAPDPAARYGEAVFALRTNHPREALGVLGARDRESIYWRTVPWTWQVVTEAYHVLGNHKEELANARRGHEQHTGLLVTIHFEILAHAALGHVNAVHSLLDEALQVTPQPIWTFGSLASSAALELRAHGHADSAVRVLHRAIDWYTAKLSESPQRNDVRYRLALCLYWARRWEEANEMATRSVAEVPKEGMPWRGIGSVSDFDYVGLIGALAARRGDRNQALRIAEQLGAVEHPNHLFGLPTLWRARIAALLGDRDGAVSLLRDAIGQGLMPLDLTDGLGYRMWIHRDIDFEPLRDYPPFQDLLRTDD